MMIFLTYVTEVLSVCTREVSLMSSGYNSMLSCGVMLDGNAEGTDSRLNMDKYGNTVFCTYKLTFPQANKTIISRRGKNSASYIPTHPPYCTVVFFKLSNRVYIKSSKCTLNCAVPEM